MTKEDYSILVSCIELAKRDDGTEFYRVKDGTPDHVAKIVSDVVFKADEDIHSWDLSYEIANDALNALYDVELDNLSEFDIYEQDSEHASIWTAARLEYLTMWNQDEIADKVRDYDCDIATAAAMWYEEQVNYMVEAFKSAILEA